MDFPTIIGTIVLIVFFYIGFVRPAQKRRRFLKDGIRGTAKIISVEKTLIKYGGRDSFAKPLMEIGLDVEFPGIPTRRLTIKQAFSTWDIPKTGQVVAVLADPEDYDRVIISPYQDI